MKKPKGIHTIFFAPLMIISGLFVFTVSLVFVSPIILFFALVFRSVFDVVTAILDKYL